MTKQCAFTGKKTSVGRKYSIRGISKKKKGIGLNITGKTKRTFKANLFKKKVWIPSEKRFVTKLLSANAIRTLDKIGVEAFLKKMA